MSLRKPGARLVMAVATACALSCGHVAVAQPAAETTADSSAPSLVVTEILPDTNSHDEFEYFEIHNISDQAVNLAEQGYSFAYTYVDSADTSRDVALTIEEDLTIGAGGTVVVWLSYTATNIDSFARSEDDFRAAYGMDDGPRIVRATGQPGMANSGGRGVRVLQDGGVSSWSYYPSGSVAPHRGVEFALPTDAGAPSMTVLAMQADPSPGEVRAEQLVPTQQQDPEPDDGDGGGDGGGGSLFDGREAPDSAAPLVLTELMVDTDNVGSSDGYEYIEIANTSDQPIDFSDYTINYLYPIDEQTNSNAALWPAVPDDVVIEPGGTLVFWIKNGTNDDLTAEDFNRQWGTGLEAGVDLVEIHTGGMANGSARGVQIQTNTGFAVNRGHYNMDGRDVATNAGLQFVVDPEDLGKQELLGAGTPTPGALDPSQLPATPVSLPEDDTAPEITDSTAGTVVPGQPFVFEFTAEDDSQVRTLTLQLRSSAGDDSRVVNLEADGEDTYRHELPAADITGKQWFEYTVTASDGTNEITTDTARVEVEGAETGPVRLNLTDGGWVSGTTDVIGAADTLDDEVTLRIGADEVDTVSSLEASPTFAMEVTQTDVYFRNGVLAGDEVLTVFDEGTYERTETVSTAVPLHHITDDGTLTVSVYAGTKAWPKVDPDENNDDFQIRNLRLILPDGRTLIPAGSDDPAEWLRMGDSAGKLDFFDAEFALPEDAFTGVAHAWDTTALDDGEYEVTAELADGESVTRTVKVDNTGPEVEVSGIGEGEELRGNVELTVEATDTGAGVDEVIATLDGERIELPHGTGSTELEPGEHTLVVIAVDQLGNTTERTIVFSTPEEQPGSGDYAPADGDVVRPGDVTLTAKADDPTGDTVDMTFYEGLAPELDGDDIRMSTGTVTDAADTARAEALALTGEQVEQLTTIDGLTHEVTSDAQFPYQLFEVDVPAGTDEDARVRANWSGEADGRAQVMLYALSADGSGWVELDRHLTGQDAESFTLEGLVDAGEFSRDGTVTLLVQHSEGFAGQDHTSRDSEVVPAHPEDEPRSSYDFTLAWESDTQYYNEEYFEHQVAIHDYLLEQQENMNIQYLFHTGDVVDDYDQMYQWEHADPEYRRLDEAGLPYSILAGNHDVGGMANDYSNFSRYFGEERYANNPWYAGGHQDNRGHYSLFSAGGIDFIVVAMGWAPGDEQIAWMNEVLAAHPERVGIINLHEFMLTTGGLGPIPQRILDEVAATNPNVRMIMSGHYHDAYQRTDSFDDDGDGIDDRTVTSMLFDYQGLPEGGQGYLRLLHFDNEGQRVMVRTYSPSLETYTSDEPSLLGPEDNLYMYQEFDLPYAQLGIEPEGRVLATDSFSAEILTDNEIGSVQGVESPGTASVVWEDREEGEHGWYVRTADEHGGEHLSPVMTFTVSGNADNGDDDPTNGTSSGSSRGGFLSSLTNLFPGNGSSGSLLTALLPIGVVASVVGLAASALPGIVGYLDEQR